MDGYWSQTTAEHDRPLQTTGLRLRRPAAAASVSYGRKQAITAHNRAKQTTTGLLLPRDPGGRRRI